MKRSDEINVLCTSLMQDIYNELNNRDNTINNKIQKMIHRLEESLAEQGIGARQRQVIIEKVLGATSELLAKDLDTKRENIYNGMNFIMQKYCEIEPEDVEEEKRKQTKTKSMLEEQNEVNKPSEVIIQDKLQYALSRTINVLAKMGVLDSTLQQIELSGNNIIANTITIINTEIDGSDKKVKQILDEGLEEIYAQALKYTEGKQQESNAWELSPEEEAAFRQGEQEVLEKYEAGELTNNGAIKHEPLRADDIF